MTTQTTAKHTPLEWFAVGSPDDTNIDGTAQIRSDDATIAHVFGTIDGSPKGNAAFIVQAVNNHYALVEALRIMVDVFNVEAIDLLKAFIAIEREYLTLESCPQCGGSGGVDSGGLTPWGTSISLPYPSCTKKMKINWQKTTITGPQCTPNANLPPLGEGPRRKMIIEIEVTADFEKRLDNQWMVEREIHADRWAWRWADESNPSKSSSNQIAQLTEALKCALSQDPSHWRDICHVALKSNP